MRTLVAYYVAAPLVLALCQPASAVLNYNIVPLGITDAEHTRNDGSKYSFAGSMNDAGQVSGYSPRYNGSTIAGYSVWVYNGAATINIGLTGPEYTRNDGYKHSYAGNINQAGQVAGYSNRYNGGSTQLGQSAWLYDGAATQDIGFSDSNYTRNDGYKYSAIVLDSGKQINLNDRGQAVGYSYRYNGGSTILGQTAWLYDGSANIDIGLTGLDYTRDDGYKASSPSQLNAAGQVVGTSTRYNSGSTSLGSAAWFYDGSTTTAIGLTGPEQTRNDGYSYNWTNELNAAGYVRGYAYRYNGGSAQLGQTAWLFDGATTIDIGFTGPEHTRNDGYKSTTSVEMNQAGQIRGYSSRYNGGSAQLGTSAWLYNGTTTTDIGFTGPEHTRNDGSKSSSTLEMNHAGQVRGYSNRYNGGSSSLGQTAWLYNGTTTIDIGLSGPEFTRNDGFKSSPSLKMNQAGKVAGYSGRYNGSTFFGQTAWLYNGATTTDIGLTGAEHIRNDGYRYSSPLYLNQASQIAGYSYRYNGGGTQLGQTAWLHNGATTIDIGLTGPENTQSNGNKYSSVSALNEAGQVIGYSIRYNGGTLSLGQDAWFYDPVLNQTVSFNLSTRSDGHAYSRADYLGDDGLVLGRYTLFDAQGTNLGNRAFSFTTADGLHDLGSLVEGGLAANGWDWLEGVNIQQGPAIQATRLGHILGNGKLTSQSSSPLFPYLLKPGIAGDFNGDGSVDVADYIFWRKSSGTIGDYDKWRANFGATASANAQAAMTAHSVVPEPNAWLLASLVAWGSAAIGRPRGKNVVGKCRAVNRIQFCIEAFVRNSNPDSSLSSASFRPRVLLETFF